MKSCHSSKKGARNIKTDDLTSYVVSETCSVIGCVMTGVESTGRDVGEDWRTGEPSEALTTGAAVLPSSNGI